MCGFWGALIRRGEPPLNFGSPLAPPLHPHHIRLLPETPSPPNAPDPLCNILRPFLPTAAAKGRTPVPPIQPPLLQEPSRTPLQNHLGGGMLKGLFWSRREPQKSIINTEDFEIQAQGACKPGQQSFKVREGVGRPQIGEAMMVMMLTPCPSIISIIGNAPPIPLSTHQQPLDNSLFGGSGAGGGRRDGSHPSTAFAEAVSR